MMHCKEVVRDNHEEIKVYKFELNWKRRIEEI
jgi:hypothetical protein